MLDFDFIFRQLHPADMAWHIQIAEDFQPECFAVQLEFQDSILTMTRPLRHASTLRGLRIEYAESARFHNVNGRETIPENKSAGGRDADIRL